MTENRSLSSENRWKRFALAVMAFGFVSLFAAAVLLVLTLTGSIGSKGYSGPGTTIDIGDISDALTPLATATPVYPTPSNASVARLVIAKYGVDAPIQVKTVDANNQMQSPDGPTNVAWYDFTGKPGYGSNAVFSGHVDYINYGPAVFYNIRSLVPGDIIEVRLEDGTVYSYSVVSINSVSANPTQEELASIVGPSDTDIITLITCGGTFNYSTHEYDSRTIVRASRVLQPATASAQ
jgi:LPXTG-site transpeptidase (sortase) family protein